MTVAITRMGLDAAAFRRAAARESDAAASRRMLALALVLEGRTRTEAARAAGMDRQTLRDWVHRYNPAGLAGLKNRAGARGRRRKLTEAQGQVRDLLDKSAGALRAEAGVGVVMAAWYS
jgi:transposase